MSNDRPAGETGAQAWAAWARSMLNGLAGDYLHRQQNPLAIEMACYAGGRPLPLSPQAIAELHPEPSARVCVLVHGLGCTEAVWQYRDAASPGRAVSYGTLLQEELGHTPFYVRYNSGLALATNGAQLDALLDALLRSYPLAAPDLVLIGHSMGGLVIRSACHFAARRGHAWLGQLRRVFFLGTPHAGAPLARLGQIATGVLHAVPNPITRLVGDVLDQRSQGVKDLHSGGPLHIDEPHGDGPAHGGWPAHVRHYLLVGTLADDPRHPASFLFGDGLVRLPSAPAPVPPEHIQIFPRTHHLQLAGDAAVYQQIRAWCDDA